MFVSTFKLEASKVMFSIVLILATHMVVLDLTCSISGGIQHPATFKFLAL